MGGQVSKTIVEYSITRDARVPWDEGDLEMENGWRCIPVPPKPDGLGEWEIYDTRCENYMATSALCFCGSLTGRKVGNVR